MNSIGKECNELKIKYDECFQVWFSEKFLKGDTNDDMCKPIFNVYRDCVRVSFTDLYFCILNYLGIYDSICDFLFFQRAMKENNIDLNEVDREILGTPDEKKPTSSDEN